MESEDRIGIAEEVADRLKVSVPRVYEMARKNLIPCVRMGRQVRFSERAIREWIEAGGQGLKD